MVKIEVLGTGCSKCNILAKNVEKAVKEMEIEAEVVKVESLQDLMNRGVMMIPALYINGEERAVGRAPSVEEIKELLK
ncbi:MAG: thioredoxin family protein [Methanotrichaceae archaeon]